MLLLQHFPEPGPVLLLAHDCLHLHPGLQTRIVAALFALFPVLRGDDALAARFRLALHLRFHLLLDDAAEERTAAEAGADTVVEVVAVGGDVADGA